MLVILGERLGPYELLEEIGEGGMGEVWKARDTRLDRIIAIKRSNQGRGGAWNRDGVILFADPIMPSRKVFASGGPVSDVTLFDAEAGDQAHYYPQFLPGGRRFLYLVRSQNAERRGLYSGSIDDPPAKNRETAFLTVFPGCARPLDIASHGRSKPFL